MNTSVVLYYFLNSCKLCIIKVFKFIKPYHSRLKARFYGPEISKFDFSSSEESSQEEQMEEQGDAIQGAARDLGDGG